MLWWVSVRTRNAGVVSSSLARVTIKTPSARKATGNHLIKSNFIEKPYLCLWFLLPSGSSMWRRFYTMQQWMGAWYQGRGKVLRGDELATLPSKALVQDDISLASCSWHSLTSSIGLKFVLPFIFIGLANRLQWPSAARWPSSGYQQEATIWRCKQTEFGLRARPSTTFYVSQ